MTQVVQRGAVDRLEGGDSQPGNEAGSQRLKAVALEARDALRFGARIGRWKDAGLRLGPAELRHLAKYRSGELRRNVNDAKRAFGHGRLFDG